MSQRSKPAGLILKTVFVFACLSGSLLAADLPMPSPTLDRGYHLLYNLDFDHAQQVFSTWQQQHPEDPQAPAAEAAGLLFAEFHRLGVLESQFYTDDHAFQERQKLTPDPEVRQRFETALNQAETEAKARLAHDPKDREALFSMVLVFGLRADYAALIEKRNLASLRFTKQANQWAQQLLAVDPECYDAHLATGISQYIIGSMAAPVRFFLKLGGVSGDKQNGNSGTPTYRATRPLSGSLRAHPAGHRLRSRKGCDSRPHVVGLAAERFPPESVIRPRNRPARRATLNSVASRNPRKISPSNHKIPRNCRVVTSPVMIVDMPRPRISPV